MKLAKDKHSEHHRLSFFEQVKNDAKRMHDSNNFQQLFGSIIICNFIVSLVQAQMVPGEASTAAGAFHILDLVFTGLFTIELIITFIAHAGLALSVCLSVCLSVSPSLSISISLSPSQHMQVGGCEHLPHLDKVT